MSVRATITVGDRRFELGHSPVPNSLHRVEVVGGKRTQTRVAELEVKAGEKAVVEVRYQLPTAPGKLQASVGFLTTDPKARFISLEFAAEAVKHFDITPDIRFEKPIKHDQRRKFTVFLRSEKAPEFELLDPVSLPPFVEITTKRRAQRPDGKRAWQVEGWFGPKAKPGSYLTEIYFKTRVPGKQPATRHLARIGIWAKVEAAPSTRRKTPDPN